MRIEQFIHGKRGSGVSCHGMELEQYQITH